MAFSGNVSCMGLPEVVSFLAQNGVEGALTVVGVAASVRLYLTGGRVLCSLVAPPGRPTGRLAEGELDVLVQRGETLREERKRAERPRSGRYDSVALDAIMARARKVSQARERAPAVTGKIDPAEMRALLERAERLNLDERHVKAAEAIHQVFTWDEAHFEFQPGPVPEGVIDALRAGDGLVLDARSLLMEAARRADERERMPVVGPHGTRLAERPRRQARPGDETHEEALQGDLRGVGLAAVLQALRSHRRSGTLSVTAAGREEQLYFQAGEVYVLRRDSPEADEFARAFLGDDATARMERMVSSSLAARKVDESQLSAEEIRAVKDQFLELLFWDGAAFAFYQDRLPREFDQPTEYVTKIALETDRFLLEAIQRLGEWDGIRQVLGGDGDPVLRFVDFQWKLSAVRAHERSDLLTLIDGRRSLEDLVRQTGLTHLEVGRVVAPLVAAGSLEVVPRP